MKMLGDFVSHIVDGHFKVNVIGEKSIMQKNEKGGLKKIRRKRNGRRREPLRNEMRIKKNSTPLAYLNSFQS